MKKKSINQKILHNKGATSDSGQKLWKRAKRLIPGGNMLLSKRAEMFLPEHWPAYYSRAKGCKVWDLDGKEFIDMSIMAVGACILGYADDDVDGAVIESIQKGVNSTLNCPEEVELAEALIELHPWFGMVRYARSGGEALSVAVRIARTKTKRETVLFSCNVSTPAQRGFNMAQEALATVTSMSGRAQARNAEGELRELGVGDQLRNGETVVTPDGGTVELSLSDGSCLSAKESTFCEES